MGQRELTSHANSERVQCLPRAGSSRAARATLCLLVATFGCGGTTHGRGNDDPSPLGPTSAGGASSSNSGGGPSTDGPDGGAAGLPVSLAGFPKYFRFVRLTNAQWGASVQQVLKLPKPSGLGASFQVPVIGTTDFSNNELLLEVDGQAWADFQQAAENLAASVTASDEALATVYSGDDMAGFIETVGRRAYRRPLTEDEVASYSALFESVSASPSSAGRSPFLRGAAIVIQALLQSPAFLYRSELGPEGEPLDGYEAAAKLSLWLRGASPDDALLDNAETLSSADALAKEAGAMLEEPSATEVLRQFHGELYRLDYFQQLSKVGVEAYDPALNTEYEESSYRFFDQIFERGEGLRDILTSTRGFMGPRMATLYGLPSPSSGFVERELGPERAGYFSQSPYLALFAHNNEPDSIHRGAELALHVLCAPLSTPASGVPSLPPRPPGQTNRQWLETMTAGCGFRCHNEIIDPLGFAFEHFDGMGRYRDTEDGGLPIDSSGTYSLASGQVDFADNVELMAALADSDEAHLCYAKKLASFGLQRDIVPSDLPWLTPLARSSQDDAASLKDLILSLVKSDAFRVRAGGEP